MFSVPGYLFSSLKVVISFSDYEHHVTAAIKPIAGNRENGVDEFQDLWFI